MRISLDAHHKNRLRNRCTVYYARKIKKMKKKQRDVAMHLDAISASRYKRGVLPAKICTGRSKCNAEVTRCKYNSIDRILSVHYCTAVYWYAQITLYNVLPSEITRKLNNLCTRTAGTSNTMLIFLRRISLVEASWTTYSCCCRRTLPKDAN